MQNSALDVGWVERSATQHISGCWVMQSLQRHLLQRGKPAQRSGSPTYNFFCNIKAMTVHYQTTEIFSEIKYDSYISKVVENLAS